MKVRENKIDNKTVTQIYLSEEESATGEVQHNIQKIREKNKNVVIFVSGNNETKKVLENMIRIIKKEMIEEY